MNINEVANRAAVTFPPRIQANPANPANPAIPAPGQQTDPETGRVRDAAASSPAVQVQQAQAARADDPAVRDRGGLEELQKAVEKLQEFVSIAASDIQFSIDKDLGRTVVKVIDRETKDVIRQIPSEEMLDLAKALDKALGEPQGVLVKQKA
jgi:flagellar protein FlaG